MTSADSPTLPTFTTEEQWFISLSDREAIELFKRHKVGQLLVEQVLELEAKLRHYQYLLSGRLAPGRKGDTFSAKGGSHMAKKTKKTKTAKKSK